MPLAKIVYASMTGNTEACADIVADKLEELGFEVELDECTSVDADDMADADLCIVGTYTYGDGELPDELSDFTRIARLIIGKRVYGCSVQAILSMRFLVRAIMLKRNLKKHLLELKLGVKLRFVPHAHSAPISMTKPLS
ncbi:Flavodoxin [Lactococcus cremoris]|nr:Flavodoxin [Lactococcus cremoris]